MNLSVPAQSRRRVAVLVVLAVSVLGVAVGWATRSGPRKRSAEAEAKQPVVWRLLPSRTVRFRGDNWEMPEHWEVIAADTYGANTLIAIDRIRGAEDPDEDIWVKVQGDVREAGTEEVAARYLAALPQSREVRTWRDELPSGVRCVAGECVAGDGVHLVYVYVNVDKEVVVIDCRSGAPALDEKRRDGLRSAFATLLDV